MEEKNPRGNVENEVRRLGENLKQAVQQAWDSDERKNLQDEIDASFKQLGESLDKFVVEVTSGPTGQRIQADLNNVREQLESGETERKVRDNLSEMIRKINVEIEKFTSPEKKDEGEAKTPDPGADNE